ncbi:hypothetical protein JCM11491_006132 [Sporobolomyces phaffii]
MARLEHLPAELLVLVVMKALRQKQSDLAALALTSRMLYRLVTPFLLATPALLSHRQISHFLRTCTEWKNPLSTDQHIKQSPVAPHSLIIGYSKHSEHSRLPDLRLSAEVGLFRSLTTLLLFNVFDPSHSIPALLGGRSILRLSLHSLRITTTSTRIVDQITLSYLLGAAGLLPSRESALAPRDVVQASEIFPTYSRYEPPARTITDGSDVGLDDCGNLVPFLARRAWCDFDVFASLFDYDHVNSRWPPLGYGDVCSNLLRGWGFFGLVQLELTIHHVHHLVLLLATDVVRFVRRLRLIHSALRVSNEHVMLMRRAITSLERLRDPEALPAHGQAIAAHIVAIEDSFQTSASNVFLYDEFLYVIPGHHVWPILSLQETEVFGRYHGPQLEHLDLSELGLVLT